MKTFSITGFSTGMKNDRRHFHLSRLSKYCIYAFFLPVIIMFIVIIGKSIYPFGSNCFLRTDMYHQYLPFMCEFHRKLVRGGSLDFSWTIGLGSNFSALYAYYLASPVNWLCALCPTHALIEFMTVLIVIKIGLCGASCCYYLSKHFDVINDSMVMFSLFYSLSGFMAAYNWNIMWLDSVALAPLVILGLEKLVSEGKWKYYCVTLALCVLANYYISIMICLFIQQHQLVDLFLVALACRRQLQFLKHLPQTFLELWIVQYGHHAQADTFTMQIAIHAEVSFIGMAERMTEIQQFSFSVLFFVFFYDFFLDLQTAGNDLF